MWFPSQNAKNYLNKYLNLPASGLEQDWEIELANPRRIAEFIEFYHKKDLSIDCRKALIALILSSFEDSIWNSIFNDNHWNMFSEIIRSDPEIFRDVLFPWISPDGDDFAISSRVKLLLA